MDYLIVLYRTILFYIIITVLYRFMGKREVGQLGIVDLIVSIMFAIFSAFIMTGKSNIKDMYLWSGKNEPSKYQDIIDYIKYNEYDDKLIEFENKMKEKDSVEYLIYKYRFKEGKTFAEISELLDMDSPRITQYLDKIAFAIRLYCGI